MIRFLWNIATSLVAAVVAFLVANWVVAGFHMSLSGFVIAVVVFVIAQAILAPFVFNMARKYASPVLGGIGIVSTLLALWVATLFSDGIRIDGAGSWVLSALVVWLVTALGGWVLMFLVGKRFLNERRDGNGRGRPMEDVL